WYGPSWREALEGVGFAAALQHPVPNGHSIGEIVLHTTTWHDVARRRLEGESPKVTDEQDWPRASFANEEEWAAATRRLFDTGRELAAAIVRFPGERLLEERPNNAGTWYALMISMLQHDLY